MNEEQLTVFKSIIDGNLTQRNVAKDTLFSLGKVNRIIAELQQMSYMDKNLHLTTKGQKYRTSRRPHRAVILAAGYGMRMVPINTEEPKGLLEVNGETLIERLIKQLHTVGIDEIYIVVGFMKERTIPLRVDT